MQGQAVVDGKDGTTLPAAWERGHDCGGLCELQGPAHYGSLRALGHSGTPHLLTVT